TALLVGADRKAWIVAGLVLILPIVQLIPLPPALWQRLPGRELETASLALVGAADHWMPWSMSPPRTVASLLVMVPTVALVPIIASLGRRGRALVVALIAAMAILALIVGTGQIAGGPMSAAGGNALRFYVPEASFLNGFQGNHNSSADMLMIGMVALAAAVREWLELPSESDRKSRRRHVSMALAGVALGTVLFTMGVFLTGSRAGTALLPVPLLAVAVIMRPWLKFSRRTVLIALAVAAIAALAALTLLLNNAAIGRVLARYDFAGEGRPDIWRDALYAMRQYFPFGSGMGTFQPVFEAAERLEVVTYSKTGRAHNDLLELAIEGGAFGLALLTMISAILANAARQAWASRHSERSSGGRAQVLFAIAALAVIALHSQVDYPLRSMSLAFVAATCAGLLMPFPRGRKPGG
ncbi:MAG: O-antigen ligase family protein, partial [Novosphingobium sp.]